MFSGWIQKKWNNIGEIQEQTKAYPKFRSTYTYRYSILGNLHSENVGT